MRAKEFTTERCRLLVLMGLYWMYLSGKVWGTVPEVLGIFCKLGELTELELKTATHSLSGKLYRTRIIEKAALVARTEDLVDPGKPFKICVGERALLGLTSRGHDKKIDDVRTIKECPIALSSDGLKQAERHQGLSEEYQGLASKFLAQLRPEAATA
jgi:hypothetical protein